MAAEVAKKEGTFLSLLDVTALYEKYFASIRNDITDLQDRNLLKTAGIISFFQSVDRSNTELMENIKEAFEIPQGVFWEAALRLHDLEVVDIHENEVVRISDQVLATYLFYLAFFKDRLLNFSALLDHFFPYLRHRLVDAINPVLNAFDSDAIEKAMLPHVNRTWESMEKAENDEALFQLMEVFWFLKPTETLLSIKGRIQEMVEDPMDISKINFKADSFVPSSSLLSLLRLFSYTDVEIARIAVDLLLRYVAKRPKDVPFVLHILTEDFGFKHISYIRNFVIQIMVIELLWKHARNGADYLHSRLFLFIGKQYLHTYFQELEMKGRRTFTFHKFTLPPTADVFELRRVIWIYLFELYDVPMLQAHVLAILHSYRELIYPDPVTDIIAQDMSEIITFIVSRLDPTSYYHCLIVNDYLDILDERGLTYDVTLRDQFTNEAYKISKILLIDWLEKGELDLEEHQKLKREKILEYFNGFSLKNYEKFFKLCLDIKEALGPDNKGYRLEVGIADVLMVLADKNHNLYPEVLEYYLSLGNSFDLNPIPLIGSLIKICGAQHTYIVIRINFYNFYYSIQTSRSNNLHNFCILRTCKKIL